MNNYTLFTPGPVDVPDDILKAMSKSLVYHREQKFSTVFAETSANLQEVLGTKGRIFFFSASGTGAMDAAYRNLLSHDDHPIIAVCGKFGQRWLEICHSYHGDPIFTEVAYGKSIDPAIIEEILSKKKIPMVIFTTLTETSTGALNNIKTLGEISAKHDSYLVVDGVAGIGADVCRQDEWNIDILVGASQKALMSPPGISFLSVSDRAFEKMQKSDLAGYYFDINIYEKFRIKNQTPWTPAINVFFALQIGLENILKKGVEETFDHHKKLAEYVRERIKSMDFELLPENPSNALTVIKMQGDSSTEIIKELKEKHGILFADGQAELKGHIIRIGHMGNYNVSKVSRALNALETTLRQRRG